MTDIKGLARHLDLSIGTVSRALNAKPDVNEKTRQRVLKAARELGYLPNQSGRSLRHGRTSTVGLILVTGSSSTLGGDTFFMHLTDTMRETLDARGLDLVLLPCRSADDPIEFIARQVSRRMVDALVITDTRRHDARIEFLLKENTPFLALGRSATSGAYPWIDLDFAGVARDSVAALAKLGHKRIAVAAARRDVNLTHIYLEAYQTALEEFDLEFDPELVLRSSASENGGWEIADALLNMRDRPTAVMLGHELMAIGVYSSLAQAGLSVGRDLSVIGLRQTPQLNFLSPALTCFSLDLRALGQAVGEAVAKLVLGERDGELANVIWPMKLVATDSIQPPR